MTLIAQHGYDNVTIEMITEEADVGKGTYFNYFATKDAMMVAFIEDQNELLLNRVAAKWVGANPSSAWDALLEILVCTAQQEGRTKPFARALLALMPQNPTVRAAAMRSHDSALAEMLPLVKQAQQEGTVRSDIPAELIARHVLNNYMAALHCWTMSDSDVSLKTMFMNALTLTLEGIGNRTAPRAQEDTHAR